MPSNVKIIYNWIGPYGPTPNDDLPNIFNLAGVSGLHPQSSRYFAEDLWHRLFKTDTRYEIGTSFSVKEFDYFIFPFDLRWRIVFGQNFYNNNGLLEWAHVPNHITHFVRERNGYFLIDCSVEAYVENAHLWALHGYFNGLKIPLHKVIYLTGCMNANKIYDEFLDLNNLSAEPRDKLSIITYPRSFPSLQNLPFGPKVNYNIHSLPERLFLSWNRRFRQHRIFLALLLEREGLIDKTFMSMNKVSDENSSHRFTDHVPSDYFPEEIVGKFVDRLPLILDGETNENEMCSDPTGKTNTFYQKSLVSLVTETNCFTREITLTEKAFKPMRFKHPFIFVGVQGTLHELKKIGFKTFDRFWNEDYDNIENHQDRLEAIVGVCKEIASWDDQGILEFKKNVSPILEHNSNILNIKYSDKILKQVYFKVKSMTEEMPKKILVFGAGGFIGSHLAKRLKQKGHTVIGVDLKRSEYLHDVYDNFIISDLRNKAEVDAVIEEDVDEIYQLAADMGGAGYIFTKQHDADILSNNCLINLNVLKSMQEKGVKKIFYSSSACIYPEHNQLDPNNPNCEESSAYPANPDSEYGWEKLFSERLFNSYALNYGIEVRIARFHNIFGPFGAWNNGREKAPAALCRKVAEADNKGTIEIWGDGLQTRSFLYIEDALDGIEKLMASSYNKPLNLGSNRMISINDLAKTIIMISGKEIHISNITGPTGVRGRNSDNRLIKQELNWAPPDNLFLGLTETYRWIQGLVR